MIIYRPVCANANATSSLHCINIGTQEKEFPILLFLLFFDQPFDRSHGEFFTGVLHTISCDHEHRVLWHIIFAHNGMYMADMLNGAAHSVQQSSHTAYIIILAGHWCDFLNISTIMKCLHFAIKQDSSYHCLTGLLFLLFNHRIEAANGIRLQARHGTATIQNKNQFSCILFHFVPP